MLVLVKMAEEAEAVSAAVNGSDGKERALEVLPKMLEAESPREKSGTENSWSAPIVSLARKATETLTGGVGSGATLRDGGPGPGAVGERLTEQSDGDGATKPPGTR